MMAKILQEVSFGHVQSCQTLERAQGRWSLGSGMKLGAQQPVTDEQ